MLVLDSGVNAIVNMCLPILLPPLLLSFFENDFEIFHSLRFEVGKAFSVIDCIFDRFIKRFKLEFWLFWLEVRS